MTTSTNAYLKKHLHTISNIFLSFILHLTRSRKKNPAVFFTLEICTLFNIQFQGPLTFETSIVTRVQKLTFASLLFDKSEIFCS